jgi:hypothetical protein
MVGGGHNARRLTERGDEHRHLPTALQPANDRSASSMPAATQRFFIRPSRQRLTLPIVVRATEIIDSMALVVVRLRARRPSMPRRRTVNMSVRPSRSEPAASGWSRSSSAAITFARGEARRWVGLAERLGQPAIDPRGELLAQVAGHVAPLVERAALDEGLPVEDLAHRGREGLGAVDHDQQAALGRDPLAWRSARRSVTTVLFSVSPSHSPTGTFRPSVVMTRAATQH